MTVNNYVTLNEVKAYMPVNEVSDTNIWDGLVTTICSTLSRAFDTLTWRPPGSYLVTDPVTNLFDGIPTTATDYQQLLAIGELAGSPTLVTINGLAVVSSDYWVVPYNAVNMFRPFTHLYMDPAGTTRTWGNKLHSIAITGPFGYSALVPPDVKEAMLLFVARFVRKAQQNYQETGTILDGGQIMITAKRDEDLQQLIQHYKRSSLGAGTFVPTGGYS